MTSCKHTLGDIQYNVKVYIYFIYIYIVSLYIQYNVKVYKLNDKDLNTES